MKKFLAILLTLALVMSCGMIAMAEDAELTTIKVLGYERNKDTNGNGFMGDRETQLAWQAANELFVEAGLNMEYEIILDSEQFKTTVQTRLASAYDLPDLVYGGSTDVPTLLDMADMGTILKINEILEITKGNAYNYFYGGEGDRARGLISDAEGNFYWLPRIQINQLNGKESGTSMCLCIRKDWLEKVDMAVPTTLDEFTAALKAFQENDVNGNGVVDEVIVSDTSYFSVGMNLWFGIPTTMSNSIGINLTEKTVESAWYNENIDEYFTFIQMLTKEGLLSKDYIGTDTSSSAAYAGNQVAACEYYPIGSYQEATVIAGGCPEAYYIGIVPIEAVEGTKPFYSEETPYLVYLRHCVTSAASDKLEAIATYFDTVYSQDFLDVMQYGAKDTMYTVDETGKVTDLSGWGVVSTNERKDKGMASIDEIARFFVPTVRHNERADELGNTAINWPEKVEYELLVNDWEPKTPNDNTGYFALSNEEETEILSDYNTDLATASAEIAAGLSLGNIAIDEIPAKVEELKAMGLDEVLAVYTAQYNRAQGIE